MILIVFFFFQREKIDELNSSAQLNFDLKSNDETQLWVEKFRPKNFLELLSDDVINL